MPIRIQRPSASGTTRGLPPSTPNALARWDDSDALVLKDSPNLTFDGVKLSMPVDAVTTHIELGASADLTLDHDGTDSHIINDTGQLIIQNTGGGIDLLPSTTVSANIIEGNASGGAITLRGSANSPTGGSVNISGGGASTTGGAITIAGGLGGANGGNVVLSGGDGPTGTSGSASIKGGSGDDTGVGGDVFVSGGQAGFTSGKGGDIIITSGNAEGPGEDSGVITIDAGTSIGGSGAGIGDILLARNDGKVGIGTGSVAASALLELTSASLGFLGTRMTTAERDNIPNPATLLQIGNITTNEPNFFDGTVWRSVISAGMGQVDSVAGGTNINVTGTAVDPIVNLDDAISVATSIEVGTPANDVIRLTHDLTEGFITNVSGDLTIDNFGTTSDIIARIGTLTNATNFRVRDSSDNNLFTVDGAGLVGIGTDTPAVLLDIQGPGPVVSVRHTTDFGSAAINLLGGRNAGAANANLALLRGFNTRSGSDVVVSQIAFKNGASGTSAGSLALLTREESGVLTDRLVIDDIGRVGISTASPKSNLHVLTSGVTSGLGTVPADRGLVISGAGASTRIYFEDTAATAGERVFSIGHEGVALEFNSYNDTASGFDTQNLLTMQHDGPVGMGTSNPDAAAALEILSTIRGFLQPRTTTAQRDAIPTPPNGLSIHNNETNGPQYFDGTVWRSQSALSSFEVEIFDAADLDLLDAGDVITVDGIALLITLKESITSVKRFNVINGGRLTLRFNAAWTYSGTVNFLTVATGGTLNIKDGAIFGSSSATLFDVTAAATVTFSNMTVLFFGEYGTIRETANVLMSNNGFFLGDGSLSLIDNASTAISSWGLSSAAAVSGALIRVSGLKTGFFNFSASNIALQSGESFIRFDPFAPVLEANITRIRATGGDGLFDTSGGTTGTFVSVADAAVALTTINSVTDSSGVARFNFTVGPTLFVDQEVDIVNFVTETSYNQTGIITVVGAGFFEIASIVFTDDDDTGDFSSDSVTMVETATTIVDGDTVVINTLNGTQYDGGATVYNQLTNQFQINRTFSISRSGTWDTAGIAFSDPRILAKDNPGFQDSRSIAFAFVNDDSQSDTSIADGTYAAVDVTGISINGSSQRFKVVDPAAGVFAFFGNEPFNGTMTAFLSSTKAGSTVNYRFSPSINSAVPVFASASYTPIELKTTKVGVTTIDPVVLQPGDTIQIMVAGDGTADDIKITDLRLSIQ